MPGSVPTTPFDSVESAQRYVGLLEEAVAEAQAGISRDIAAAVRKHQSRQLDALRLVNHKLTELGVHLRATSRILNDLRMLRRVLLAEDEEI